MSAASAARRRLVWPSPGRLHAGALAPLPRLSRLDRPDDMRRYVDHVLAAEPAGMRPVLRAGPRLEARQEAWQEEAEFLAALLAALAAGPAWGETRATAGVAAALAAALAGGLVPLGLGVRREAGSTVFGPDSRQALHDALAEALADALARSRGTGILGRAAFRPAPRAELFSFLNPSPRPR